MDEKNKRNMENEEPSPAAMGLLYLFVGLLIFGVCMIVLSIFHEKPDVVDEDVVKGISDNKIILTSFTPTESTYKMCNDFDYVVYSREKRSDGIELVVFAKKNVFKK